jgi:hypothetical protein
MSAKSISNVYALVIIPAGAVSYRMPFSIPLAQVSSSQPLESLQGKKIHMLTVQSPWSIQWKRELNTAQ